MGKRYQDEIEDILRKAGEAPGADRKADRRPPRPRRPRPQRRAGGRPWRLTSGKVFLASVALLLSALVMRSVAPGLVGLLAWTGVALFIVAYAMFFMRPRPPVEKRWRGRPVDDRDDEDFRDRLRRWWRR